MPRPNPVSTTTEPSDTSVTMYGVQIQDLDGTWITMPGVVVLEGDYDDESVYINDLGGATLAIAADETLNGYTIQTFTSTT